MSLPEMIQYFLIDVYTFPFWRILDEDILSIKVTESQSHPLHHNNDVFITLESDVSVFTFQVLFYKTEEGNRSDMILSIKINSSYGKISLYPFYQKTLLSLDLLSSRPLLYLSYYLLWPLKTCLFPLNNNTGVYTSWESENLYLRQLTKKKVNK